MASSGIPGPLLSVLNFVNKISPPAAGPAPRDYDGLEFKWKMFVFRPAMFKYEGMIIAVLGGYVLLSFLLGLLNKARARST